MKWSPAQDNIFDFCTDDLNGSGIVVAVAGSGKTTTLVEANNRIAFQYPDSIFLAFNKSIAAELKERGVDARTFHSLAYRPVLDYFGAKKVDGDKIRKLCKQHLSYADNRRFSLFIQRFVSTAMNSGFDTKDMRQLGSAMCRHYALDTIFNEDDGTLLSDGMALAIDIFEKSLRSSMVSFDDMLYHGAGNKDVHLDQYEFVFVDEAQDTNLLQHNLISKIMGPMSRLLAVGDPRQAIYGFRGADTESLNTIKVRWECEELPLNVSYRCAKSIVRYANTFSDGSTRAAENAPDGKVRIVTGYWSIPYNKGDMVICRRNAPLLKVAFHLVRKNIPASIVGKDLAAQLINLVKRLKAKDGPDLRIKLEQWCQKEIIRMMNLDDGDVDLTPIYDKRDCIVVLLDNCKSGMIDELLGAIENIFNRSTRDCVTLSTIHKAKGLEADRVVWLDYDWVSKYATLPWQIEQEKNLCYVAATRAKTKLILVES